MSVREIDKLFYQLGVNKAYLGFRYAVHCVEMILNDEELKYYIKVPYVDTATRYNTTVKCVERDVRTLIMQIWKKGNRCLLNEIAGYELGERPKSKAFLAMAAEYLREQTQNAEME